MKIKLYKHAGKGVRCLKISVLPTLFDEWLLTKEVGGLYAKRPSIIQMEYYGGKFDAIKAYSECMLVEIANGFSKKEAAA